MNNWNSVLWGRFKVTTTTVSVVNVKVVCACSTQDVEPGILLISILTWHVKKREILWITFWHTLSAAFLCFLGGCRRVCGAAQDSHIYKLHSLITQRTVRHFFYPASSLILGPVTNLPGPVVPHAESADGWASEDVQLEHCDYNTVTAKHSSTVDSRWVSHQWSFSKSLPFLKSILIIIKLWIRLSWAYIFTRQGDTIITKITQ